ncbi:FAD/NAD(P)-binding protein [Achromobacter marplatensis]|uniref:FAD/NAD(P)-binding protein n=1 Tax=Achromobacter marplatensis TaxID=470868 RepID=UPI0039F67157
MTSAGPFPQPLAADLAIVGGGSVAVSLLYQFLLALQGDGARLADRPLRVVLFEPQAELGPGGAYQEDLPSNLLNIPAGNMSARADQRMDFVDWLRGQDPAWLRAYGVDAVAPSDFLPRPLFGAYLRAVHARCRELASSLGVTLTHVQSRAQSVTPVDDGAARVDDVRLDDRRVGAGAGPVRVAPEHGAPWLARHVVLCNGNLPSQAFPHLEDAPGYFNSPYPVSALTGAIARDASVCVVGTSLSAVDAIAALQQSGHRGPILCVSRNGRLPAVRSPHNQPPAALRHLSREGALQLAARHGGTLSVAVIAQALKDEVRAAGGALDTDDVLGLEADAQTALDEEIRRSSQAARPWQAVAAATNAAVDQIWHLMPDAERSRFQSQWRSLWMARRATFPMRNALKLQALFQSGQLQVRAGYVDSRHDPADQLFHTRLRGAAGIATHSSRYLINATSFSVDAGATRDPLVAALLRDGHARPDPFGGLALDFATGCLRNAQDALLPRISVLGSLAGGTYFWTTSMDVNARLARDQAQRLAAALTCQPPLIGPESPADSPSPARWPARTPTHPAPTASS